MANKKESKLRDAIKFPKSMRLTCQTRMKKEPVKVERIIKDETEISLYVKLNNRSLKPIALKPLGEEKYLVLFFLDIRDISIIFSPTNSICIFFFFCSKSIRMLQDQNDPFHPLPFCRAMIFPCCTMRLPTSFTEISIIGGCFIGLSQPAAGPAAIP